MKSAVKFFIENGKFTLLLTLLTLVWGGMGLMKLNRQTFPSVDMATAIINTPYRGASASDIEVKITRPVENEIKKVAGLKDVTSTSMPGFSTIKVRVDMDNQVVSEVMDDLQKALDRVTDLPGDLRERPVLEELDSDAISVLELAVTGEGSQRNRNLYADQLKDALEDVDGVGGIELIGYQERQYRIYLDQDKLDRHHIGIDEVLQKIRARNVNIPGGKLSGRENNNLVRLEGEVADLKDLQDLLLRANFSGKKVWLKDVARVVDGEEDPEKKVSFNGKDATLLVIRKSSQADTLQVVQGLNEEVKNFQKSRPQFQISVSHNEATKVDNKLSVLGSNAVSGFLLVVLFLLVFLPGRLGLMASLSLPVAILGTFGMMSLLGANLNSVTILALVIALGMLVDNAVVVTENYTRLIKEGYEPKEAAITAVTQIWLPVTATALTTIAAFLPMMVTQGVLGEFIKYIPVVVSVSLLLSLAESFFLLPMRIAGVSGKKSGSIHKDDWFENVKGWFERFMMWCIRQRYIVAILSLLAVGGAGFMLVKVNKFILFPAGETERYIARYELPSGTPVEKTYAESQRLTRSIIEVMGADLDNVVNKAGDGKLGIMDAKAARGEHNGMVIIKVTKKASKTLHSDDALKRLRTIPKGNLAELNFEAEIMGPPVGGAINMTFRSHDRTQLRGLTDQVFARMEKIPGVNNLKFTELAPGTEIYGVIDHATIGRLGLDLDQVGNTLRTALQGNLISDVQDGQKVVYIKVEMENSWKNNVADLKTLKVMDRRGNLIPLDRLVDFKNRPGEAEIHHFDFKESRTLVGDVDTALITSAQANKMLTEAFHSLKEKYPQVSYTVGGEAESTKESMTSLALAMVLALLGIFALLVFIFKSYMRPAIIMTTIPLGFIGFAVAFYFHQLPVSFLSLIGMVGLSGIVVNSGIVLISFIDQLREEGKYSLDVVLAKASGMRLRAVLVTSLTTFSGLIPTAYGIGGSDPMLMPLTLAMAWGLASGTLFTLVWVPCGYAILEDMFLFMRKINPFASQKSASEISDGASVAGGGTEPSLAVQPAARVEV